MSYMDWSFNITCSVFQHLLGDSLNTDKGDNADSSFHRVCAVKCVCIYIFLQFKATGN